MRLASLSLVFVFAFAAGALHGCGGSSGAKPTPKCVLPSDCSGTLVCALGFCVSPCNESKDCPTGQLCVKVGTDNACRAPEVASKMCAQNSDCKTPLVCGRDLSCRQECVEDVDCPGGNKPDGQKCTESHTCADPKLDKNYDPITNDFKPPTTGTAGTGVAGATGSAGSGGAGTTGAAGSQNDGGSDAPSDSPTGAAGTGADGSAGTTGAAGIGSDGGTGNPDSALVVDSTTVTPNKAVRQGQSSVTITITKTAGGLSNASVVSFGAIPAARAAVQSTSTDTSLVIRISQVPHGTALGKQTLVVSTKGGTVTAADVIEVTAITAAPGPTGVDSNSGSSASPYRSFGQAILVADTGDTIHLLDGTYSAATVAMGGSEEKWMNTIPNNVTIVGDSVAGTILDGSGGPSSADGLDAPAMVTVQNLTLKRFRYGVNVTAPNTAVKMDHVAITGSSTSGIYIAPEATGSTITITGKDSLIEQATGYYGIQMNGSSTTTNAKVTVNITDATLKAASNAIYMYYMSGTTLNLTGVVINETSTADAISIYQANNVIANTITVKDSAITGTLQINDKTVTVNMTGGSIDQKSGDGVAIQNATAVNLSGTKITMSTNSNAVALNAPNASLSLNNVTIIGGSAGVNQAGAGSTAKLRGTKIMNSYYYGYNMTAGTLDLGTDADPGLNGIGVPVYTGYYSLNVGTNCTITSSATHFGGKADASNNLGEGVTPGTGVIAGPATRAPQIYGIGAGSQISFF